ncbi:MAG: hypothetical protein ABI894_03615 [Ilumatobacteraceae bacterium]
MSLVFANVADFAGVNLANVCLADRTQSHRSISLLGAVMCVGARIALIAHIAADRPQDLILLGGLLALTYAGEATDQHRRPTTPTHQPAKTEAPG